MGKMKVEKGCGPGEPGAGGGWNQNEGCTKKLFGNL